MKRRPAPARPARPLASSEEKAVRDAVLASLTRVAAYAENLPERLLLDWTPKPDRVLLTGGIAQALQAAMLKAGEREVARLAPVRKDTAVLTTGFDRTDPRALDWAQTHAASLVTAITEQQRQSIRAVIATSFSEQVTGPDTARRLRSVVGLHPRYATAVDNAHLLAYKRNIKAGFPDDQARDMAYAHATRYRDRLIRSRASTIARTEIMTAQNRARQLAWTQQVEDGALSPLSRKQWVAHDSVPVPTKRKGKGLSNPCRVCADLHGQTRRWDEPWPGGYQHPPAHPNCRCVQVILPPALPGDDDYLDDLSTASIENAIAESRDAWDGFEPQAIAPRIDDLPGAVARRQAWKRYSDAGFSMVRIGSDIVPTQKTLDAVAKTQRAGSLIRRKAERRAAASAPDLKAAAQTTAREYAAVTSRIRAALDKGDDVTALSREAAKAARRARRASEAWAGRVADEVARGVREARPTGKPLQFTGVKPAAGLDRLSTLIPDDWQPGPINVVHEQVRPYALPHLGSIHLDTATSTASTIAHETMHILTHQRRTVNALQWAWLAGRIHATKPLWHPIRRKDISTVDPHYSPGETYLPDVGLRHPYPARTYGDFGPTQPYELLPVAIEQLLDGFYPNLRSTLDTDVVDLLIGALVSL